MSPLAAGWIRSISSVAAWVSGSNKLTKHLGMRMPVRSATGAAMLA